MLIPEALSPHPSAPGVAAAVPPADTVGQARAIQISPQRLMAVRATGLLDSSAEAGFDGLTATAARLLHAAACFISIVDEHRDFYKSQCGFPDGLAQVRQLEGLTFCHFTLDRSDALVIEDTHATPIWASVPTVQGLGVRAYVGVPLKSEGQNIGSFCVIDVKPRAWTADELETIRQLAVSAARELDLRAALAAAQRAAESARSQALAREQVLAVVAHDLRTPLQVLQLSTRLLQRGGPAAQQQQPTLQRMQAAIDVMATMVDGLLKPSEAAPAMQPIPVETLARDAVHMMAPLAEKSHITLQLQALPDAVVRVDYGQLVRVLGNLIGNSLKYSPEGSVVSVSGARTGGGDMVDIVVSDNGVGMTPQEAAQAFNAGWQSEAARARNDGVGLGLAIVKSLVEANQGYVRIESREGAGTSVTLTLPCG